MDVALLNFVGGILGGSVVTVLGGLIFRKRTKAETTNLITQAADRVMHQMQAQNERLSHDVSILWKAVHQLAALVREHGGDPSQVIAELNAARTRTKERTPNEPTQSS